MRKSILFGLLSLIAIVAVACGNGNDANGTKGNTKANAGNSGGGCTGDACTGGGGCTGTDEGPTASDPYAFYKVKGRSWTHKSTSKMGETETISFIKYEITDVTDTEATQKMSMFDKDMKPNEWVKPSESKIPFATATTTDGTEAPKVETTEETIEAAGKSWDCTVTETEANGMKTKSWSSKEFPGLLIKSVTDGEAGGMKMHTVTELTEWNAG